MRGAPLAERRLLVVGCSRSKDDAPGDLPARQRYTGRVFRALDRFEEAGLLDGVTLAILSARYGLLLPDDPIEWYDRRMTSARAEALRHSVSGRLATVVSRGRFVAVLLWLEAEYLAAVDTSLLPAAPAVETRLPPEGTGPVRAWLAGELGSGKGAGVR